jgi:hypothetical protein
MRRIDLVSLLCYTDLKAVSFMELIFEFFFELYLELMLYIVPDMGVTSKKHRRTAALIAVTVLLVTLAMFIWGCVLVCDYGNYFGFIPIIIATAISVTQIVLGFIFHNKKK